jgi:tRNA pseudouridine38-40 synthase
MKRMKLTLSYDGYYINGWTGVNGVFVDKLLMNAIYNLCGEEVIVVCGGRTDCGVHALNQVCHFDLSVEYDRDYVRGLNFYLPDFIRIKYAEWVNMDFHARFSAKRRHYTYLISNSLHLKYKSYILRDDINNLNYDLMNEAINIIKRLEDLSFFYPAIYFKSNKSCNIQRTIDDISISYVNFLHDNIMCIDFSARSFAHHQVRNIMGCLIKLGTNEWNIDEFKNRLSTNNRNYCAPTANPNGLYLSKITY